MANAPHLCRTPSATTLEDRIVKKRLEIVAVASLSALILLAWGVLAQTTPKNRIGMDFVKIAPGEFMMGGLPVVRGGGWDQRDAFRRVSARYSYYGPTLRVSDIGFRLVRE